MKRILVVVLALAFIGGIAFGDPTNQVLSKNAVGYVKVTIPKGSLMMIQTPFENLTGEAGFSIGALLGSNLPNATIAYFWHTGLQQYRSEQYFTSLTRWMPGTNIFDRGQGMFVKIPSSATLDSYDVFLMGEVPDEVVAPTTDVAIVKGLQMIGYMYPTEILLTNSVLRSIAKNGDILYYWKTNQQWGSEQYFASLGRWMPGTLVLQPGQAYYYKTTNVTVWSEAKPYTWP